MAKRTRKKIGRYDVSSHEQPNDYSEVYRLSGEHLKDVVEAFKRNIGDPIFVNQMRAVFVYQVGNCGINVWECNETVLEINNRSPKEREKTLKLLEEAFK